MEFDLIEDLIYYKIPFQMSDEEWQVFIDYEVIYRQSAIIIINMEADTSKAWLN